MKWNKLIQPMKTDLQSSALGRAELTQVFCEKLKLDRKDAASLLETLIDSLMDSFKQGHSLKVQGLGTFSVHQKKERPGRNPKTKEKVNVPSRHVVRLNTSALLHKRLNNEI